MFTKLYTFESMYEILRCDHTNERYWAIGPEVLFIILYKASLWMKP